MAGTAIYDLHHPFFLTHDINHILSSINTLYAIEFKDDKILYRSKTTVDKTEKWFSNASKEAFNKVIPVAKSLLKDMYSVLESVSKAMTGSFDKTGLEKKYKYFKEFRLLNNNFKHYENKEVVIDLTEVVLMENSAHVIEIFCNFKYENDFISISFSEFVNVFLIILQDERIIEINR